MTGTSKRTVRCNPPSRLSFLRNVPLGLTATPARRTRGLPAEGPGPRPRSPGGSATAGAGAGSGVSPPAPEPYHCRVSCVCFFLSFMICVMLFFADGLWSAAFSAPSPAPASSSSEERASLVKRVSERRGGNKKRYPRASLRSGSTPPSSRRDCGLAGARLTGRPARRCLRGRAGPGRGPAAALRPRRIPRSSDGSGACRTCPARGLKTDRCRHPTSYLPWCRRAAPAPGAAASRLPPRRTAPPRRRAASLAPPSPRSDPPARPGGAGRRPLARVPWPCSSPAPPLTRHGRRQAAGRDGTGRGGRGGGLRERRAPTGAWAAPAVCAGLWRLGGRRCQPSAGSVRGGEATARGRRRRGTGAALRRLPGRLHGSRAGWGGRARGRHSLLTAAPPRPRRGAPPRMGSRRSPSGGSGELCRPLPPALRRAQSGRSRLAGRGRGMAWRPGDA